MSEGLEIIWRKTLKFQLHLDLTQIKLRHIREIWLKITIICLGMLANLSSDYICFPLAGSFFSRIVSLQVCQRKHLATCWEMLPQSFQDYLAFPLCSLQDTLTVA
jgi:hypothetical protein